MYDHDTAEPALPCAAGRTPTGAWLAPGMTFVMLLAVLWPRPYMTRAGDELYYHSGARHLAETGTYSEDFSTPATVPITRHPPLLSLTWAVLLRCGLDDLDAFFLMQALFLFGLGALGGALAYLIHGSWLGPLTWTLLNACWPGGSNWWLWTTPHAESGIMFFFVLVAWLLVRATAAPRDAARGWLLAAACAGGLAMTMKGTGIFTLPVIIAVVVWHLWRPPVDVDAGLPVAPPRDRTTARVVFLGCCVALMLIPYALWGLRNLRLVGVIESDKYVHDLSATWVIMRFTTEAILEWLLPQTWARPLAGAVHPAVVLGGFMIVAVLCGGPAGRRRQAAALIPWAIAITAYGAMIVMMTWMYTHEARFWTALLPCLTLAPLAMRAPRHPVWGRVCRLLVVALLLYLCLRFVTSNRRLWYGTPASYLCLQALIAAAALSAATAVARLMAGGRAGLTTPLIALACGGLLILFWRSAQQARPVILLLPLLAGGVGAVMIATEGGLRRVVGVAIGALTSVATWTSGHWSLSDFTPPAPYIDRRHGIPTPLHPDTHHARRLLRGRTWPTYFASNRWCYLDDLFDRAHHVGLPRYPDRARFVRGEAQDPAEVRAIKAAWIAELRARSLDDAVVVIHFPNQTEIDRAGFFTSYYGPEDLEDVAGLDVEWVHKEPAVHIAVLHVVDARTPPGNDALAIERAATRAGRGRASTAR